MAKKYSLPLGKVTIIILAFILVFVAMQRIMFPVISPSNGTKEGDECVGTPIFVDYPYQGDMLNPHECKVQCDDSNKEWRYIVYTNKVGTQCEKPPMCSDWGEDNNVTCEPEEDAE